MYSDPSFTEFFTALQARVPALSLWAAGPRPPRIPPWMSVHSLSIPLRCPPAVHREVEQAVERHPFARHRPALYSCPPSPAVTDGPAVRRLTPSGQHGHSEYDGGECEQCGEVIAQELEELGVGGTGRCCCCCYDYYCFFLEVFCFVLLIFFIL